MLILLNSKKDDIRLVDAIAERARTLVSLHLRVKGVALHPPGDLLKDFSLFNEVMDRYRGKDYRHTDDEMRSIRRIAQWTLDLNAELRNQEKTVMEWRD